MPVKISMREGGKGGTQRAAGKKMHARPPNIIGVIRFDSPGEESEGSGKEGSFLSFNNHLWGTNDEAAENFDCYSHNRCKIFLPFKQVLEQFLD